MITYRLSDTITLEKFPKAIDVNPEEQTVLITNYLDQTLTKIDLLTRRSIISPVNRYPLDVAWNTIDNRAVVLCDLDRKLLLLDLNAYATLNTYLLPRHPQSVAVNSLRNIAVVADDETDGLTIIPLPLSPTLPKIAITSPLDNAQLSSETVNVSGTVENSTKVTVNGTAASVSGNAFSATLTLKAGQNTLAATATDKYGRTACHSILVDIVLPVKGKITGTVTNAATGLLLPLALVTITDAAGNTQTIATIISGTYTAEIAPGPFTGTVIKPWYLPSSFAGSVNAGDTATMNVPLTPADPTISSINVSEIKAESAKISWSTDQPTQGTVQYASTTAYGNIAADVAEQTEHTVLLTNLTPSTTYHFRIAATSSNGVTVFSSDNTFKTPGKIGITIASPADGANIGGNSVTVTGSVSNAANVETGITVNGLAAALYNNQFTVNSVPLNAGQNTITVTATDIKGATASKSITVNAEIPTNFIKLSVYPESGVAPMEVSLRINGTFSISNPTITFTGSGTVEQDITDDTEEYKYKITTEGIYNFTAQVTGPDGSTYSDTVAINVLPLAQTDAMFRAKWTSLTDALQRGDTASALILVMPSRRANYEIVFNLLKDQWVSITASYLSFTLISMEDSIAKYELAALKNGKTYVYQIDFKKDASGLWFIDEF